MVAVAELGKLISARLKELPADHPGRKFLEDQLNNIKVGESKIPQASKILEEDPGVVKAKERLEKLIADTNKRRGGCSPYALNDHESIKDKENALYGEQSVVNLLPSDFVLFKAIMAPLRRRGIHTKQELANTPRGDFKKLRGVGHIKLEIIEAMQNLAIAEINAQATQAQKT